MCYEKRKGNAIGHYQKLIMKKIIYYFIFFIAVMTGCKREQVHPTIVVAVPSGPVYLAHVQQWLKVHMGVADYNSIDFTQTHISKDSTTWYLRFGLKNKPLATDFLLLQTDTLVQPLDGRMVHIDTKINDGYKIDGRLALQSLDGKIKMESGISDGYVEQWHPAIFATNAKAESLVDPSGQLPEVIVYGYKPYPNAGYAFDTYLSLLSMFSGGKGSTTYPGATLYSQINGSSYGGGAASGSSGPPSSGSGGNNDYYVNIENTPNKPGLDLEAWLKCFTDISDAGASCTITICADLPVDDDPTANVNLYNGATGHCYMELKKTNGAQSVTQVIGFTAQDPFAAIVHGDEFVPGKLVDNAGHKYDASITMNTSAEAFNRALEQMKSMSKNLAYSITRFDCLDFALDVFNSIRPNNPLILPKMYNTGNTWDVISTGERMYDFLSNMKDYGDAEAPNILIGGPLYIGTSHGPCY